MRALDPEVVDAVWEAVKGRLPEREDTHPLGCHNPRIPDRVCFEGILIRLVTGCSWVTTERLLGGRVSDTTLRARRDEWIAAGVFDGLVTEAIEGYDRIVGLDLTETAVDGLATQSALRRGWYRQKPHSPGETGLEMVSFDRPQRHTGLLGHLRRQPTRHRPVRTHPDARRPIRTRL